MDEAPPTTARSFLDLLLHPAVRDAGPRPRTRARSFVASAVAVIALAVLDLFNPFLGGGAGDPMVPTTVIVAFSLVLVLYRITGHYRLAAGTFLLASVGIAVWAIPAHGGLHTVYALWLPLLPAVTLALLDYRAAVASVFFVAGFCVVLVAGHHQGIVPTPPVPAERNPVEFARVLLLSALFFLAISYAREQALEDSKGAQSDEARARARAEAASRAKSSILASVSHELRTPMTGILGLTDLLSDTRLDPQQSEWVRTIHKTGNALLALLDDLLDTARLDAGNLALKERPFRPYDLAEQVVALFRPRAKAKRLAIRLDVSPDVPVKVRGDAARVRQVLINLVGNAVKFTEQGGIVLRVDFSDPHLVLEVADTGIGIGEDAIDDVFTPFVRGQTDAAANAGGVGLGLSIARLLVEAMAGEIHVHSRVGLGTTFQVVLPLAVVDADAPTTDSAMVRTSPGTSLRVLIAEDNAVNRMVLTAMLESMGHEVRVAHNGDEVVPAARAFHPDVVLMDMRMPVVDGLEATRRLRDDPRFDRLRVIALTANAFDEDRRACLEAGMDDFLSKPVTRDQLAEALDHPMPVPA